MSWGDELKNKVRPQPSRYLENVERRLQKANELSRHLKEVKLAPPLWRLNGFGVGLYGWLHDPQIKCGFIKLYFISALWIPILPLRAYLVERHETGYHIYQALSLYGVCRCFGWRAVNLYITSIVEGAGWLIFVITILAIVIGGAHLRLNAL